MICKLMALIAIAAAISGQTPPVWSQTATAHKPSAVAKSDVDNVIELVKGGMSEALVIKYLQREGKTYKLGTADLLRLQKAGVTENIINVMMDPKAGFAANPNAPAPPESTGKDPLSTSGAAAAQAPPAGNTSRAATPYPPDLPDASTASRKPRLMIDAFGYRDSKEQAQYWFQNNSVDIGAGVSAMVSGRLNNVSDFTVLERSKLPALQEELKKGTTTGFDQAQRARLGRLVGADYILVGDVVQFGWDTKTSHHQIPTWIVPKSQIFGGIDLSRTESKANVAITFRLVDTETGEQVAGMSGDAKGESSRKANKYGGTLAAPGAGWINGGGDMTTTAFCKTIIGEATSSAVDAIVSQLSARVARLPLKQRSIEGKLANVSANRAYLASGADQGILKGDRFAILQITDEIIDPDTKERLDYRTVKVGELVVDDVRARIASGNYGGEPLSEAQLAGKGYAARLMSK